MKLILGISILLALTACTTTPKKEKSVMTTPSYEAPAEPTPSIDYFALQNHFHMERDRETLGFAEKSFNTCDAGYGYSRSQNCHKEHLVVIHFQLLCRDSEGTISTVLSDADLQPLDRRTVKWALKGAQGSVQTDSQGYGQIVMATPPSQKAQRIKLAIGSEFLYTRANELKKIITPQPWCNQY